MIRLRLPAAAFGIAFLAGCATPRGELVLQVANQSDHPIRSIQMTPCGASGWPGEELLADDIRPRTARRLALPRECIDLVAINSQGEVAGRQTNLELVSESTWTLR